MEGKDGTPAPNLPWSVAELVSLLRGAVLVIVCVCTLQGGEVSS